MTLSRNSGLVYVLVAVASGAFGIWIGRNVLPRRAGEVARPTVRAQWERVSDGQDPAPVSDRNRWRTSPDHVSSSGSEHSPLDLADPLAAARSQSSTSKTAVDVEKLALAAKDALGLPAGRARSQALVNAVTAWATMDPIAAAAFANALPPGRVREEAIERVLHTWFATNPAGVGEWLETLPVGPYREAVTLKAISALSDSAPQTAADIASTLAEGPIRQRALHQIARQWTMDDSDGAARWLESLPTGLGRDTAIAGYVESIDGYDARLATLWADTISDPEKRVGLTAGAAQRWMQSDETAARQWVQNSTLPEEYRLKLLNGQR